MKIRNLTWAFLLVLIICSSSVSAFVQDEHDLRSVQGEGSTAIVGNNLARAQRDAIQAALRMAVEKSTAQLLSPEVIATKTKILQSKIYDAADAYIQTYRLIAESPSQKVYVVNLIAMVDHTVLKKDLEALGVTVAVRTRQLATLSMTVRGIRSYIHYARFINTLRNEVGGVKIVRIRQAQQGSIRLDLDTEDTLQELADKLGKTGRFSFQLKQISEKELAVTLLDQ